MNVRHLSVAVPNSQCVNDCQFCVSKMLGHRFENKLDVNHPHYDVNVSQYMKRLKYVADCGCKTALFTGTSEPQQNKQFLSTFTLLNMCLGKPFTNLEMQTTGFMLTGNRNYVRFLRNFVGIDTVALSVNALEDEKNYEILGHSPDSNMIRLKELCALLKEYDFNVRICFNLNSAFNGHAGAEILTYAKNEFLADQVTIRKLYVSDEKTSQSRWIREHAIDDDVIESFRTTLAIKSKPLGKSVYGTELREYDGMSVFFDDDCIGKHTAGSGTDETHMILAPDCRLYSSWASKASLVF